MIRSAEVFKRIQADGLIEPTVAEEILNPAVLEASLGGAFQYAQAVEAEISESAGIVRTLLPNMSEELSDFFEVWETQEARHGEAQLQVLQRLRVSPAPQVKKASALLNIAGKLAGFSSGFHDAVETGVLVYAALGERETQIAYKKMTEKLAELGETPLADRLMAPMAKQEALHLGYYRAAIGERREKLAPWQLRLVSKYIEISYLPVGVQRNNRERMRGFGQMTLIISDDPYEPAIQAQNLAASLLDEAASTKPFITKRYRQCLEELGV